MIRWRRLSVISMLLIITMLFITPSHRINAASGPVVTFATGAQVNPQKVQFVTQNDTEQNATITLRLPSTLMADTGDDTTAALTWNEPLTQAKLTLFAHQTQRWTIAVKTLTFGSGTIQVLDSQQRELAKQEISVAPNQSSNVTAATLSGSDDVSAGVSSSSQIDVKGNEGTGNKDQSHVQVPTTGTVSDTASSASASTGSSSISSSQTNHDNNSNSDKSGVQKPTDQNVPATSSWVTQTQATQQSGEHPIKDLPQVRAADASSNPMIDYGDPLAGNRVHYTGGSLSLPVFLTAPRAGRYLVYLELWSDRYQGVDEIVIPAAVNRQKFTVTIPAEYMPQYSDQLSGFNLYVGDENNNFSDPLHYVLSLDVPDRPSNVLGVVAPNAITFNPTDNPIDASTAWHQKLPARIIPVDSDAVGANTLSVLDGREEMTSWTLTVSASQSEQLTGADHDVLFDAMHYLHNGRDLPINNNQVLVATQGEYPSETIHDVDYHLYSTVTNISQNWNTNNGLFLEAPTGTGGGEAYSGSVTWHVTDGVANN